MVSSEETMDGRILAEDSPHRRSLTHASIMSTFMQRNQSAFNLAGLMMEDPSMMERMKMQMAMESELLASMQHKASFQLVDMLPILCEGIQVVVEDDFHKCFQENPPRQWNWSTTLYGLWLIGIIVRYLVLFPLRLLSLVIAFILTVMGLSLAFIIPGEARRNRFKCSCISFLACGFVFSWTGIIYFHGKLPTRKPNQIYVANHTSMIDVIVLLQLAPFSVVGQHHSGWVAFFQDTVLACLDCIWFQRNEVKDRCLTANRIKETISKEAGPRLLIFPEGTCVNNEYCVQFKKGCFEMDAEICPIAIKYNNNYVDAFWNSRARPFHWHLFDLMTGWAFVADVWFLTPVTRNPNETPIEFASRVKRTVAEQAGLKNVEWDGYMKYLVPSSRFTQKRQEVFADGLKMALEAVPAVVAPDDEDEVLSRKRSSTAPNDGLKSRSSIRHRASA